MPRDRNEFVIDPRILSVRRTILVSGGIELRRISAEQHLRDGGRSAFQKLGGDMERIAEIGASIVIKGDLTAQENVVISGRVEGSISVENHSVTIRPGAELAADIDARVVVVGGQVTGTISAAETIELQRSAQVEGEIVAASLRLDDGAVFNGKAQTTKARSSQKLQLAS